MPLGLAVLAIYTIGMIAFAAWYSRKVLNINPYHDHIREMYQDMGWKWATAGMVLGVMSQLLLWPIFWPQMARRRDRRRRGR